MCFMVFLSQSTAPRNQIPQKNLHGQVMASWQVFKAGTWITWIPRRGWWKIHGGIVGMLYPWLAGIHLHWKFAGFMVDSTTQSSIVSMCGFSIAIFFRVPEGISWGIWPTSVTIMMGFVMWELILSSSSHPSLQGLPLFDHVWSKKSNASKLCLISNFNRKKRRIYGMNNNESWCFLATAGWPIPVPSISWLKRNIVITVQ